ncbi:Homocysteine S-methyltransferase 1 [Platanthera zijinensis]|uniref:Homocysteine S-methyltransferase 1 n=1 Tax=Platanthera zijinensis TaxID=2320716 RepID=A0AAP0C145_9ASPA
MAEALLYLSTATPWPRPPPLAPVTLSSGKLFFQSRSEHGKLDLLHFFQIRTLLQRCTSRSNPTPAISFSCVARDDKHNSDSISLHHVHLEHYYFSTILVAISIGSFRDYLADGFENLDDYLGVINLVTWKDSHKGRPQASIEVVGKMKLEFSAWFSFSDNDEYSVVNGGSFVDRASITIASENVVETGINCTPPQYIHGLVLSFWKKNPKFPYNNWQEIMSVG